MQRLISLMDYDSSYQNEQGNSPEFKQYLQRVANLLETKMGSRSLVEVGCGKGKFLELMLDRDADIVGYDPTYEGDNPKVRRVFFRRIRNTRRRLDPSMFLNTLKTL